MAGLVKQIKNEVKKAGANKGKFVFIREGEKKRYRFLTDADDGIEFTFHDNFSGGVPPTPCQELFDRACPYCDDDEIRTRSQYAWSVWDYDANEVKVFMFPVNNCSPVPHLISMYETYGTLTDRDYMISVSGKQQNKSYAVVPMDKVKFRNASAKPFSENKLIKMLDKAFPCDGVESEDDDDYEEKPNRKSAKKSEVDDYDEQDWGDEEDEKPDYENMSAKELYGLCKSRDIDVPIKKSAKFYIMQLNEYDAAQDEWGDDGDEWEDE